MSTDRHTIRIQIVRVDDQGEVVGDAVETFGPTWASDDFDALFLLATKIDTFCQENFQATVGEEHTSSLWPDLIHKTPRKTSTRRLN